MERFVSWDVFLKSLRWPAAGKRVRIEGGAAGYAAEGPLPSAAGSARTGTEQSARLHALRTSFYRNRTQRTIPHRTSIPYIFLDVQTANGDLPINMEKNVQPLGGTRIRPVFFPVPEARPGWKAEFTVSLKKSRGIAIKIAPDAGIYSFQPDDFLIYFMLYRSLRRLVLFCDSRIKRRFARYNDPARVS